MLHQFTVAVQQGYLIANFLDLAEKGIMGDTKVRLFVDRLKIYLERNESFIAWFGLGTFFFFLITWALAKGGRWDLYEPIAMADRWPDRYGYSKGIIDQFIPSTPYFPGVSFLALFIPFKIYQVEVMLLIANSCILILYGLLFFIYRKFGGERSAISYITFSAAISCLILAPWLTYAKEFKPDTIALCFFVLAFLASTSIDRNPLRTMVLIGSVLMALLFKQQIIAPITGLLIGRLVSEISIAEKIKDALMVSAGLFIGAVIVLSIDGAAFYAVQSHVGREHISIFDRGHMLLVIKLIAVFVLGYLTLGKEGFLHKICRPLKFYSYSIPMGLWGLAGIAGAINVGGNTGNTAVGVVLAIPILALICDKIKSWAMSILFVALALFCLIAPVKKGWIDEYHKRLAVEGEVAQKIRDGHFKSALISGDSYMAVRGAGLEQISEIDTWGHIHNGINKDQVSKDGNSLIDTINPDVIVCVQGCGDFDSYIFVPDKMGYIEIPLNSTSVNGIFYIKKIMMVQ